MTTQNWPDPTRPGVPLFPEQDGWHWLRVFGRATIEWWSADKQAFDNHYDPDYAIYECACLTPTQINEMLAAEQERCASVVISHAISPSPIDDPHPDAEWLNGCKHSARAIRNLGAAT